MFVVDLSQESGPEPFVTTLFPSAAAGERDFRLNILARSTQLPTLLRLEKNQFKARNLKKVEQLLNSIFAESGSEGIVDFFSFLTGAFVITRDGVVDGANQNFLELIGYDRADLYGKHASELITPDEVPGIQARFANFDESQYELKLLRQDQSIRYVHVTPLIFSVFGQRYRLAEFIDLTGQRIAQQELTESQKKYSAVFNQAAVGISRVAPDGSWLECNDKLCDIVGYTRAELLASSFQAITHPEDLEKEIVLFRETLQRKRDTYSLEKRYLKKDGELVWVNLTVSLVMDDEEHPKYCISVIDDISDRKLIEKQLRFQASHDSLTGLLNRKSLDKTLKSELDRARRYNHKVSIAMLDIDHFKAVNDSYGHAAGDKVLKLLSTDLLKALRESDTAARFGGEEFMLVLPECDAEEALETAERIRRRVECLPLKARGQAFSITASLGIATFPDDADTPTGLILQSDQAMYQAKASGRNRTVQACDTVDQH